MRPRIWIPTLSLVAAAGVLPLAAAPADQANPNPAPPTVTAAATAPAASAADARPGQVVKVVKIGEAAAAPAMRDMVVVRDAETGQLRAPNAAEWARMSESVDPLYRTDIGLEELHYEDGTVGVRLGDRYQSMMLTRRSADGKLAPTCTHDAQTATDVLTGQPATNAGETRNDQ